MSELYDQIISQRGSVENLIARIPGFRGYIDKATRRTADRMIRDHVASEIAQSINRLASIEKKILENGGLSYMSKTRGVKTKIQMFHDRVKAAAPGYSGFFETVKVGEIELERLYSFDEAQLRFADQFKTVLDTLDDAATANEGIDAAIVALDTIAVQANDAFALREDVLTNLNKGL